MRKKHFMQSLKHNKYQQMSIIMVKCFGMESRIIVVRITGSSTTAPKEEKTPPTPKTFILLPWLGLPKNPPLEAIFGKNE